MAFNKQELQQLRGVVDNSLMEYTQKVIEPALDNLYERLDKKIDEKFSEAEENLEAQTSYLERKLTVITDHQASKLDNHEHRIGKLEVSLA